MALPLIGRTAAGLRRVQMLRDKNNRVYYRDNKTGRRISQATYQREMRRDQFGRLHTNRALLQGLSDSEFENTFRNIYGTPRGGGTWAARYAASAERFEELYKDLG